MTTSTTDAEAIARIIEAEIEHDIKGNIAWANGKRAANAILSYLASRREAQEPALYQCELEDGRIEHFSAVFGEVLSSNGVRVVRRTPLYTAPPSPAPAGEVERLREALEQVRTVARDNDADGCDHRMALKFIASVTRAALNGGRHD